MLPFQQRDKARQRLRHNAALSFDTGNNLPGRALVHRRHRVGIHCLQIKYSRINGSRLRFQIASGFVLFAYLRTQRFKDPLGDLVFFEPP